MMRDQIADAAVALSLMLEALSLLDAPEHETVAAHLRSAVDALSPKGKGALPVPAQEVGEDFQASSN